MRGLWRIAEQMEHQGLVLMVAQYSYLGVFVLLVLCGLGLPVPEEVALIGGGFAVYKNGGGWGEVGLMVTVAMGGVLLGDVMLYRIGWRVGEHPEKVPFIGRHLTPDRMRQGRGLFARYGAFAVFFGRFLFGIRAVTFFLSGSLRVPLLTFLAMDGLAALISVPISVILAWYFGDKLEVAISWVREGNRIVLVAAVIGGAILAGVLWRRRKHWQALTGGLGPEDDRQDGPDEAEVQASTVPRE